MRQGGKAPPPRGVDPPLDTLPQTSLSLVKTVAPPWGPSSNSSPPGFFREPAPLTSQLTKVARLQTVISLKSEKNRERINVASSNYSG